MQVNANLIYTETDSTDRVRVYHFPDARHYAEVFTIGVGDKALDENEARYCALSRRELIELRDAINDVLGA